MSIFLTLAYLFFIGSITGWVIEVIFRRFFSSANPERKWINPGFLIGPYIPLYGFSLCLLYLISGLEDYISTGSILLDKLLLFAAMAVCITLLEYLTGLLSIKVMKVRLWDYSKIFGNVQGIICPKFSFFWAVLSAVYFFLIHPHIINALKWLSENLAFSFVIGFFFGVFAVDLFYSAHILVKIHNFAVDNGIIVRFEGLKEHIRRSKERQREKAGFLLAMASETPLYEHMRTYLSEKHGEIETILHRVKKKKK